MSSFEMLPPEPFPWYVQLLIGVAALAMLVWGLGPWRRKDGEG